MIDRYDCDEKCRDVLEALRWPDCVCCIRVPLSDRALATLDEAEGIGDGELVFPSLQGKPLYPGSLKRVLGDLGIDAVPHGFCSSFRLGAEGTDTLHAVTSCHSRRRGATTSVLHC